MTRILKSVQVKYFAVLREQANLSEERVEVAADCRTYGELYALLKEKHSFTLPLKMIQVAVDDRFASLDHEIRESARVVFIPPMAGG